jgi:hypothetical protein
MTPHTLAVAPKTSEVTFHGKICIAPTISDRRPRRVRNVGQARLDSVLSHLPMNYRYPVCHTMVFAAPGLRNETPFRTDMVGGSHTLTLKSIHSSHRTSVVTMPPLTRSRAAALAASSAAPTVLPSPEPSPQLSTAMVKSPCCPKLEGGTPMPPALPTPSATPLTLEVCVRSAPVRI